MYILNREGNIVYQHFHSPSFKYESSKEVLEKLLKEVNEQDN